MQHNELVGYARIDNEADAAVLNGRVTRLLEIGVREVFTDVGPLQDGLEGLRDAVGCLRTSDALIYPEVCLRELTVGDLPTMFGHIPDGTALTFFEPLVICGQNGGGGMTSIRLVDADGDNVDG
jgi:hypothetical protein